MPTRVTLRPARFVVPARLAAVTLLLSALTAPTTSAHDWCVPDTVNSYSPSSPVITRVTFGAIDRVSDPADKELYVVVPETTELDVGATYPFEMTYMRDTPVCPRYALRVWIDWAHDASFAQAGDLVVTVDDDAIGSVSAAVTVPPDASPGLTRMRVAMKMEVACGHSPIEACPAPEAFGWHGEIEDYDVLIVASGESDCANGSDDDGDGLIDCEDDDCLADPLGDCDEDGVANEVDCAPGNPGAWSAPPEVDLLFIDWSPSPAAALSWTGVAAVAGTDTLHDVLSGDLGDLHGATRWSDTACVVAGEPGESAADARPSPPGGAAWWYLARARNACGTGPAGIGSFGDERTVAADACP